MSRKSITTVSGTIVIVALAATAIISMSLPDRAEEARAAEGETPKAGEEKAVSVEVTTPERRPLTRTLRMPATLLAGEMADLYANTSGYISKVHVDIGDQVAKGHPLLVIDVPEMRDELRQTQAVLEAKRAKAVQAESMIDIARAEVQRAEAEHELSRINHERTVTLRKGNAIPQQELDEAQSKLAIAEALVKIARSKVAGTQADLQVARAEATVAEATVARLNTLMSYATIKAPFAGAITKRLVDPGAFVRSASEGTTTPLLSIARMDFIRLALEIPESDALFVRVGTEVEIDVKALRGKPISAKITRTARALKENTRTMRTEVDLQNKDGRLAPGMYAQVTVKLETKQLALMIPSKAIRVRGRKTSVFVAQGAKAESRPVEIGYDDGIWVEIIGGVLDENDRIIVSSNSALTPGVAVKAVPVGASKT